MYGPGYQAPPSYGVTDAPVKDKKTRREQYEERRQMSIDRYCSTMILFCIGLNAVLWIIPLIGNGWISHSVAPESTLGPIVREVSFDASLWMVDFNVECIDMGFGQIGRWTGFKKTASALHKAQPCTVIKWLGLFGQKSVRDTRDTVCLFSNFPSELAFSIRNPVLELCEYTKLLFWSSWAIFLGAILAALFALLSMGILYYYWELSPCERDRHLAMFFLCSAQGLPLLAVILYVWTVGNPYQFMWVVDPMLGGANGVTSSAGAIGIGKTFPWCLALMSCNIVFGVVLVFLAAQNLVHANEEDYEERQMRMREAEREALDEYEATLLGHVEGYDPKAATSSTPIGAPFLGGPHQPASEPPPGYGATASFASATSYGQPMSEPHPGVPSYGYT